MSTDSRMLDPNYIDPELDQLLKNGPALKGLDASTDIPTLREHLASLKRSLTSANSGEENMAVKENDQLITMRDGASITVRIHGPVKAPADGCPVFVMYHGGGFCLGGLDNETLLCRKWVTDFGGVTFNVDYRLAPEHVFPTAVTDSYDALKWVSANFKSFDGNPSKAFLIGGVSAGGGISAAISHMYRDDGLSPPLTGIYLSIPSILDPQVVPDKYKTRYLSREQNRNAPILGQEAIDLFRRLYKQDSASPLMSPLLWPSGHRGLPPTYFQIAGMDPLRDEALIYESVLRDECGVKTRLDVYPGLPHGFWSWWPKAEFSKKQLKDSLEGLAWLLASS